MGFKLKGDTPEKQRVRENALDMAKAIVIEMQKRGMEPDDWRELQSATDCEVYRNTKNVWKD